MHLYSWLRIAAQPVALLPVARHPDACVARSIAVAASDVHFCCNALLLHKMYYKVQTLPACGKLVAVLRQNHSLHMCHVQLRQDCGRPSDCNAMQAEPQNTAMLGPEGYILGAWYIPGQT